MNLLLRNVNEKHKKEFKQKNKKRRLIKFCRTVLYIHLNEKIFAFILICNLLQRYIFTLNNFYYQ